MDIMPSSRIARPAALFLLTLCGVQLAADAANDTVFITSEPPGAKIEINGRLLGTTPFNWKVGNWALNPRKSWVGSKHLSEPLTLTVILDGFVPKTIQLTGNPLRWTSLNGMNSFDYFVIHSSEVKIKLQKIGDFLGGNPFNSLGPTPQSASGPESGFEVMINRALPAVVTVTTPEGSGSGFFVNKSGVIVTNKHVVGTHSRVSVLNATGQLFETDSIYSDPDHDLAIIKVECSNCPALMLADPTSLNVGQDVIAIGSPGLAGMTFQNSVTRGIVSAFRGPGDSGHVYLQTDAQINPGNSGGPLLNKSGHVVGVNTLKVVSAGYSGLNFAISSNDVLTMLKRRFDYEAPTGKPQAPQVENSGSATQSRLAPLSGSPLNNADIIKMQGAGLSDALLIAKIKASPAAFSLEPDDLINLKKAGISEGVVGAMIEAQGRAPQ